MEFIIAVLLCLGDNCDLVRPEPQVSYPTYEACSQATANKADELSRFTASHKETGRESELLCVRQVTRVVELDEEREALVATDVRETPNGNARVIGTVARGNKMHVTGAIDNWLRISLPTGKDGYVIGERTRKLSFDEINAASRLASTSPTSPSAGAAPPPAFPNRPVAQPPPPPTQAAISVPATGKAQEFRDCSTCPLMVVVRAGSFEMGSNADSSERPVHRVTVAAFALGKFEVTQSEWSACVAAAVADTAKSSTPAVGCSYKGDTTNERRPMMNLSWDDAMRYVNWLRQTTGKPYRLPSEAEWEYAARGGTSTPYPWGQQVGVDKADCDGCATKNYDQHLPSIAGSYESNAWGLFDMFGGVAEWVDDCWHRDYAGAPSNGTAWQAAPRCSAHVLRGGSWKNPPKDVTVSTRNFYDTSVRYLANGFRVAMSTN